MGEVPAPGQAGQAAVEVLAGVPAFILAGLIALQLLAVGYAATLAGGAAEAGAAALAAGEPARPAVRASLPGWTRERVQTRVSGGRLDVTVSPPAIIGALGDALSVSDSAWVRPAS